MHRLLVNAVAGDEVDHKDGNGLRNVRSNLRHCTVKQNRQSQLKSAGKSGRFKGVSRRKPWQASIKKDGRSIHLGYFDPEEEAALAYNERARELFGEFAMLNHVAKPDRIAPGPEKNEQELAARMVRKRPKTA